MPTPPIAPLCSPSSSPRRTTPVVPILFRLLPASLRDHAAGCPDCRFYRNGRVRVCRQGVTMEAIENSKNSPIKKPSNFLFASYIIIIDRKKLKTIETE